MCCLCCAVAAQIELRLRATDSRWCCCCFPTINFSISVSSAIHHFLPFLPSCTPPILQIYLFHRSGRHQQLNGRRRCVVPAPLMVCWCCPEGRNAHSPRPGAPLPLFAFPQFLFRPVHGLVRPPIGGSRPSTKLWRAAHETVPPGLWLCSCIDLPILISSSMPPNGSSTPLRACISNSSRQACCCAIFAKMRVLYGKKHGFPSSSINGLLINAGWPIAGTRNMAWHYKNMAKIWHRNQKIWQKIWHFLK